VALVSTNGKVIGEVDDRRRCAAPRTDKTKGDASALPLSVLALRDHVRSAAIAVADVATRRPDACRRMCLFRDERSVYVRPNFMHGVAIVFLIVKPDIRIHSSLSVSEIEHGIQSGLRLVSIES
jgi:hypothetical protein